VTVIVWCSEPSPEDFIMQNIDHKHSRAICPEIGERLRESFSENQSDVPTRIQNQLNRLRELDEGSPSTVPPMVS
jgi:hypothetical protein